MKSWMNGLLDPWIIGAREGRELDSLVHQSAHPIIKAPS